MKARITIIIVILSITLLNCCPIIQGQKIFRFDSLCAKWDRYFLDNPQEKSAEDGNYSQYIRWKRFWQSRTTHSDNPFGQYQARMTDFYSNLSYYRRNTSVYSDWQLVGPKVMPTQNMGLVSAVYVDTVSDKQKKTIYVGTNSSGIWKTTDGGLNWVNVTDGCNLFVNGITDIIGDTHDGNIIYAASGGGFMGNHSYSSGIIKSTNGGQSWYPFYSLNPSSCQSVNRILLNPANSQHMFAAVDTAVLRSLDGGTTWVTILKIPRYGPVINGELRLCLEMVMKPDDPSVIYVATGYWHWAGNRKNEVWKLANALATDTNSIIRQRLDTLLPNNPYPIWTERFSVAVTPSNPDIVYIACVDSVRIDTTTRDHFRMWKYSNSSNSFVEELDIASVPDGIGYFKFEFLVSPMDTNIIYAGGLGLTKWKKTGGQWMFLETTNNSFTSPFYHDDTRDVKILKGAPKPIGYSDILFAGNDGGLSKTTDSIKTWSNLR